VFGNKSHFDRSHFGFVSRYINTGIRLITWRGVCALHDDDDDDDDDDDNDIMITTLV